jgi:ParB-like chromosome segregation protein Spo0J
VSKPPELQVRTVPVDQLTLDPDNARRHDRRNLDAIKTSLREFGMQAPLVVTSEGVVVVGNGRLTAALELGWTAVPVVEFPWSDPDKVRAFAIADNRTAELAEWDGAVLLQSLDSMSAALQPFTGFDELDVKALRAVYDDPAEAEPGSGAARDQLDAKTIRLQVSKGTHARWLVTWDGFVGDDDDERLSQLLDALGIPPAEYADDDQGV